MKIEEELLKENSLENTERISMICLHDLKQFNELFSCFVSNKYRIAQRAAAVVKQVVLKNPEIIVPYLKDLVDVLCRKDVHDAVLRNTVRILQEISIPEEFHGIVISQCFSFIEDPATPVAIKAFSLTTINNLSAFYPDIKKELKLVIEDRLDFESAAFKARAKKILATIDKEEQKVKL